MSHQHLVVALLGEVCCCCGGESSGGQRILLQIQCPGGQHGAVGTGRGTGDGRFK